MHPSSQSSVSVRDLTVRYGDLKVLDGLSLDIRQGEFLVLLGSSGCGKSTLLNTIAGLSDAETEGSIHISGKDVTAAEPKDRGIGMVFQSYALYPRMTVEKNMGFGLRIKGMPASEVRERVERTARLLRIEPLLKRRPADLSGGQRQRVAIGRALVREVDVFLFDEPLSNLDAQLRAELRIEIKRLHQSLGNTMIYVTHDQVEAMTLGDRIAVMKGGVIQQLAAPDEVYGRPANLFVAGFLGSPRMNFLTGEIALSDLGQVFVTDAGTFNLGATDVADRRFTGKAVLGIRPEHLSAAPEGMSGEVALIEPLGPETIVWVKHADGQIAIRAGAETRPDPGSTLTFALDLSRASLFDAVSGARL